MLAASVCSIAGNLLTGYPMVANLKWLASAVAAVLGFYLLKRQKYVDAYKIVIFLAILGGAIIPAWFYGGGDNSIMVLYMLLLTVIALLILDKAAARWLIMGLYGCT